LVNREPGITEREPDAPDNLTEREPKSPMIASPAADNCKRLQIAGSLILSLRSLGAGAANARRSRRVGRSRPGRGAGCDRRNGQTRRREPACRRDGNAERRSSSSASARPRGGARRNCRASSRSRPPCRFAALGPRNAIFHETARTSLISPTSGRKFI
jgi:hypothetical protein